MLGGGWRRRRRNVLPAVPFLLGVVQVEGTFRDGTKLVTVHHPISREGWGPRFGPPRLIPARSAASEPCPRDTCQACLVFLRYNRSASVCGYCGTLHASALVE